MNTDTSWLVDVAQVAGNIAVVIALWIATRQWTSTMKVSTHQAAQSHVQALNSFFLALATDPDLSTIYRNGRGKPGALNEQDKNRFFYLCVVWFAHHEYVFHQAKSGLLPEGYFQSWDAAIREDLKDPGFQEYWTEEGRFYDKPFRDYIDARIGAKSIS